MFDKVVHLQWQMLRNLLQSPVLFSSKCQPLQDMDHTILNTHLPLEHEMCEMCTRTFYKLRLSEKVFGMSLNTMEILVLKVLQ